jgi:Tol biopolymer transport system component
MRRMLLARRLLLFSICLVTGVACALRQPPSLELLFIQTGRGSLLLPAKYVVDVTKPRTVQFALPKQMGNWSQWSPDGRWVVYSLVPNGKIEQADLFLTRSDGTDLQRITNQQVGARDPTWSPDGLSIAYFSGQSGGLVTLRVECYLIGTLCDQAPRFLVSGSTFSPDWSPDGSQLAFEREGRILLVSADGDSDVKDITPRHVAFCQNPQWSPDGLTIAANCYDWKRHIIILAETDGTKSQNIMESLDGWCMNPKWSPDGKQLAISCRYVDELGEQLGLGDSATATSAVYLIERDGSSRTRVTFRDDEEVLWLTWIVPQTTTSD